MKETQQIMGMPITIEIVDPGVTQDLFDMVFDYFRAVDERFSTYKETSEISKINRGEVRENEYSEEMKNVLALCEQTKKETNGYFDIQNPSGKIDPSGLVKGWSIQSAANLIKNQGWKNYYVEAGGDVQFSGKNADDEIWSIGIQNPFSKERQIVKIVYLDNKGIATSGTYARGQHIYNPHEKNTVLTEIASLTVTGPDVYEADRFATAAFAMGKEGINFIEKLEGFEGYSIDTQGIATMTSNFDLYTHKSLTK